MQKKGLKTRVAISGLSTLVYKVCIFYLFMYIYIYIYIGNTSLEKAWNFPATPGTLELKEFAVAGPLTRISQSWSSDTR